MVSVPADGGDDGNDGGGDDDDPLAMLDIGPAAAANVLHQRMGGVGGLS